MVSALPLAPTTAIPIRPSPLGVAPGHQNAGSARR
jgi:hypothetical protein